MTIYDRDRCSFADAIMHKDINYSVNNYIKNESDDNITYPTPFELLCGNSEFIYNNITGKNTTYNEASFNFCNNLIHNIEWTLKRPISYTIDGAKILLNYLAFAYNDIGYGYLHNCFNNAFQGAINLKEDIASIKFSIDNVKYPKWIAERSHFPFICLNTIDQEIGKFTIVCMPIDDFDPETGDKIIGYQSISTRNDFNFMSPSITYLDDTTAQIDISYNKDITFLNDPWLDSIYIGYEEGPAITNISLDIPFITKLNKKLAISELDEMFSGDTCYDDLRATYMKKFQNSTYCGAISFDNMLPARSDIIPYNNLIAYTFHGNMNDYNFNPVQSWASVEEPADSESTYFSHSIEFDTTNVFILNHYNKWPATKTLYSCDLCGRYIPSEWNEAYEPGTVYNAVDLDTLEYGLGTVWNYGNPIYLTMSAYCYTYTNEAQPYDTANNVFHYSSYDLRKTLCSSTQLYTLHNDTYEDFQGNAKSGSMGGNWILENDLGEYRLNFKKFAYQILPNGIDKNQQYTFDPNYPSFTYTIPCDAPDEIGWPHDYAHEDNYIKKCNALATYTTYYSNAENAKITYGINIELENTPIKTKYGYFNKGYLLIINSMYRDFKQTISTYSEKLTIYIPSNEKILEFIFHSVDETTNEDVKYITLPTLYANIGGDFVLLSNYYFGGLDNNTDESNNANVSAFDTGFNTAYCQKGSCKTNEQYFIYFDKPFKLHGDYYEAVGGQKPLTYLLSIAVSSFTWGAMEFEERLLKYTDWQSPSGMYNPENYIHNIKPIPVEDAITSTNIFSGKKMSSISYDKQKITCNCNFDVYASVAVADLARLTAVNDLNPSSQEKIRYDRLPYEKILFGGDLPDPYYYTAEFTTDDYQMSDGYFKYGSISNRTPYVKIAEVYGSIDHDALVYLDQLRQIELEDAREEAYNYFLDFFSNAICLSVDHMFSKFNNLGEPILSDYHEKRDILGLISYFQNGNHLRDFLNCSRQIESADALLEVFLNSISPEELIYNYNDEDEALNRLISDVRMKYWYDGYYIDTYHVDKDGNTDQPMYLWQGMFSSKLVTVSYMLVPQKTNAGIHED